MEYRQNTSRRAKRHAGGIFVEGDIPAVMQTGFDQPMAPPDRQKSLRRGNTASEAGQTPFDFTAGFVDPALAHPAKLAFEPIDLADAGPIQVVIEHGTGLDRTHF